jgi:hypothetical protein
MDRAGWNKILPIRRGRKPEEGKFKKALGEEDGAKKIAYSNRQDQINSITPLGPYIQPQIIILEEAAEHTFDFSFLSKVYFIPIVAFFSFHRT